jgi:hypothetical protein
MREAFFGEMMIGARKMILDSFGGFVTGKY